MARLTKFTLLFTAVVGTQAFTQTFRQSGTPALSTHLSSKLNTNNDVALSTSSLQQLERRNFLASSAAALTTLSTILSVPAPAYASGGATAGKYTTIPIAKRRYYGRVQEAVHEFLLMAPAVIKGDLTDPVVQVQ